MRRTRLGLLGAVFSIVLVSACGGRDQALATWELGPSQTLGADSVSFMALVTRLGCHDGVTGTVNEPDLRVTADEVVVTFTVSPGPPQEASCPGNDVVPYRVVLPEPLGSRSLVDGTCESSEAAGALPCVNGAVRGVTSSSP